MRLLAALFALSVLAIGAVGCGSGDDANPNYEQKVTLTPEEKEKAKQNMAGQAPPGAAPGSAPVAAMPMPKGKGK